MLQLCGALTRVLCRHYYSWVLAMLISQQNQLLHTFPRTIFTVKNFTVGGYSCMPDKIPIDRRISYPLASNLYKVSCCAFTLLSVHFSLLSCGRVRYEVQSMKMHRVPGDVSCVSCTFWWSGWQIECVLAPAAAAILHGWWL